LQRQSLLRQSLPLHEGVFQEKVDEAGCVPRGEQVWEDEESDLWVTSQV
jgi:hypothetical protein